MKINGIGKVTGIVDPVVGMKVKFNGHYSGLQTGTITKIDDNGFMPSPDGKKAIALKEIFRVKAKSHEGDSGSLI